MKRFVQYGAGNIGRGFIGQLFSQSGYAVEFIDVNMEIINALNKDKCYPVNIVSNDGNEEIIVKNVSGINGMDIDAVAGAIAGADIMATAVGVNILPRIINPLVAGIRRRMAEGNKKPFNIIICENLLDADKYLHGLIEEKLNAEEKEYFNTYIGLVEASIGRMVPVMTDEMRKGSILRVCVERYFELPVDKAAFKGDIPEIPHLYPFTPFEFYIKRKLFIHNMGHALTAYLGYLMKYDYIWQAIGDPCIKLIVSRAMNESAAALSKKFGTPLYDLQEHISDLLIRFGNKALGDTVMRVGRDTMRKLSSNDRLSGAYALCLEQGIDPVYISMGIAAGLFFDCPDDKGTAAVKAKLALNGIDSVLADICNITNKSSAFDYIKNYYGKMNHELNLFELLNTAEMYQEKILKIKKVI